ncbi:MAG: TonB-dependent receptor [Mucilaginibacter polytrichastri]|nr:TonB-dependent receptor [Mucilaginibacter polytrichastri]
MRIFYLTVSCILFSISIVSAQNGRDTAAGVQLDSVLIRYPIHRPDITFLDSAKGTYIFTGKKSEVIRLESIDANIGVKTGRQIFAKVPGLFVYDMDGSGNQINVSTRGLDAHRGWEFNIRNNGVITNSDMYGYPASHFSMPLESIDRIELVRGTGSLQYGAQFGGMLNYVSKKADTSRKIGFESINTAGSYNLLSTYNAIGGRVGKLTYYAYLYKRSSDGYRDAAHSDANASMVSLDFAAAKNLNIKAEWSRSQYRYRTPGPLTDAQFATDPRQASRTRNYFSPDIHVPSLTFDWRITPKSRLTLLSSAVLGNRSSVQFDKPTSVRDSIVTATGAYNNRQVDIDQFHSYTTELRFMQQYTLVGGLTSTLTTGVQYMNNDLHRRQLGVGTPGTDYNLTLLQPDFGRNLHYKTQNVAFFAENNFQLTEAFSVTAGARLENGTSRLSGVIGYLPQGEVPNTIGHHFPLFGGSFQYKLSDKQNFYGGISQAYRPVILKDIVPGSAFERSSKDLSDAKGYNMELGFRGSWKFLQWDVNYFRLGYNNRLGNTVIENPPGTFLVYKSNIGNSVTNGTEIFVQGNFPLHRNVMLNVFTSTSYMEAKYTDAAVRSGNANVSVNGNFVESVPKWISRNGATLKFTRLSVSALYSYTAESFADPLNTVEPSATGAVGRVPAYSIVDLNATFLAWKNVQFKAGLNNIADKKYFTKRPTFYPGPGIWPSDGRNFNLSVGIKL